MRKIFQVLTLSSFCLAGIVHASTNDQSAALAIAGNVNGGSCTVELDHQLMHLGKHDIKDLPLSGEYDDTVSGYVNIARLAGDGCQNSGRGLALRFIGNVDGNGGYSFLNTAMGSGAAKGIGVGLYGYGKQNITPNTSSVLTFGNQYLFYVGMVKLRYSEQAPGLVESAMTIEIDRM